MFICTVKIFSGEYGDGRCLHRVMEAASGSRTRNISSNITAATDLNPLPRHCRMRNLEIRMCLLHPLFVAFHFLLVWSFSFFFLLFCFGLSLNGNEFYAYSWLNEQETYAAGNGIRDGSAASYGAGNGIRDGAYLVPFVSSVTSCLWFRIYLLVNLLIY